MSIQFHFGTKFTRAYTDYTTASQTIDIGSETAVAWGVFDASENALLTLGDITFGPDTNTLSSVAYGNFLGTDTGVYHDLSPTSGQTGNISFSWTRTVGAVDIQAVPYVITADGPLTVLAGPSTSGNAGVHSGFTLDSGSAAGYGVSWTRNGGFNPTPLSGSEEIFFDSDMDVVIESEPTTGSRTFGHYSNGVASFVGLIYSDGNIYAQPDAITLPITVPTPVVTGPGDIFAYFSALEIPIAVQTPTLDVPTPKVLATVGVHTETPGRIPNPSGLTAPALTYQNGDHVWVEHSTLETNATKLVPLTTTDASGDPALVWDDDDELILTEYYE